MNTGHVVVKTVHGSNGEIVARFNGTGSEIAASRWLHQQWLAHWNDDADSKSVGRLAVAVWWGNTRLDVYAA